MLHYFIINPTAGKHSSSENIESELKRIFKNRSDHFETYTTTSENDATVQIRKICEKRKLNQIPNEHIRFYACGGDGTCFECVNGVVGQKDVSLAILPVGSCNDFLKTFPDLDFSDLESLVNGKAEPIDILKANDSYLLNVCNIGYDAKVNYDCVMTRGRYKTIKQAYRHALIKNLMKPLGDKVKVVDENGDVLFEGKSLLLALGNGQYYGGGYRCTPLANVQDGLIEFSMIKKVSILTFLRLVGKYKKGEHITNHEKFKKYALYKQVKQITITSDDILTIALDGETLFTKKIVVDIVPKAINFVFPK